MTSKLQAELNSSLFCCFFFFLSYSINFRKIHGKSRKSKLNPWIQLFFIYTVRFSYLIQNLKIMSLFLFLVHRENLLAELLIGNHEYFLIKKKKKLKTK
jgi:hypothetical protein